jgi:hypothetical protein
LGLARDADGTVIQGLAFIHYKKEFARPEKPGNPKPPKASSCYAFLASGAKWKVLENYVFDKAVINASDRLAQIDSAIAAREMAAEKDILGAGSVGDVYPGELGAPNSLNEVMFDYLDEPGVIAMTIVWGVFGGPPAGRHLVEWDMVFDTGWSWWYEEDVPTDHVGATFDFLNIATHEIGHAVGMDHPSDACTEETMYAYANFWDTNKRDLNTGDITGIRKLYP